MKKPIRLAPDHQQSYLLLACAHLLANNSYRVRGVLQGQYIPRFGNDAAVELLLALTMQIEGDTKQSIKELQSLVDTLKNSNTVSPIAENILRYSVFYNLAELYKSIDKAAEAKNVWLDLAQFSKNEGDTLLFRLALTHISQKKEAIITQKLKQAPSINGNRLGDTMRVSEELNKSDLWVDGDRYQVIIDNGSRYIAQNNGILISAWQTDSKTNSKIDSKSQ